MDERTARLLAYVERNVDHFAAACTRCGKCFEACPLARYSGKLAGQAGGAVVTGILDLLQGRGDMPAAIEWARMCCQSAQCVKACPEKLDAMLMVRLARITALGSTGRAPLMADAKRDPNFFRRINAFATLQLTDAEIAEWH